jgi:hypothetical protein
VSVTSPALLARRRAATFIDSRTAGSRYATRVRIAAPQGSAYDGQRGTVVTRPCPDTILVRFDSGIVLPFALAEVIVL